MRIRRAKTPRYAFMWSKQTFCIWLYVRIKRPGKIGFVLPLMLPLAAVISILDMAEDLAILGSLFADRALRNKVKCTFGQARALAIGANTMLLHLGKGNLADVSVRKEGMQVELHCALF